MHPFRVHQFHLRGRHYLLLPKLNQPQMHLFAERLSTRGFTLKHGRELIARSREGALHIDPAGLCWSAFDPADAILPAIPDVLAKEKQRIPLRDLRGLYFASTILRGETLARLSTRLESGATWDALRASGECSLAPDEREVASFLMKRSLGPCRMVADFSMEGSLPMIRGRRLYFDCYADCDLACSFLRAAGERASQNSYLPRDGVLSLGHSALRRSGSFEDLFRNLGEWCFYTPG